MNDNKEKKKPNHWATAKVWLGSRLVETPKGYRLDGELAKLDEIMQAYNRMLMAMGAEQVGKESWRNK